MMRQQYGIVAVSAIVTLCALVPTNIASGYDAATHNELGRRAGQKAARLDFVLREDLGASTGFRTLFKNGRTRAAFEWIGEGAALEDEPETRVFNHFHDPFRPWSSAGLRFILPLGESSIRWAEMLDQGVGGTWSWPVARAYFLEALTGTTPEARETAFARTFRAIGHLTHLVQDATVPAHVRNDPHLSPRLPLVGRVPIDADWYEGWIETKLLGTGILDAPIKSPLPSVFTLPTDPEATLPIAGLIDTDGVTPDVGLRGLSDPADVGLAELVNPNFMSRDTIFRRYPRPAMFDLGPGFFEPVGQGLRQYFAKRVPGTDTLELSHLVAEGPLYTPLRRVVASPPNVAWTLDDARVHEAYARELVPRAIGYSAALIDYFFRGRLDVDLFDDGDAGDPSTVRVEGTNASNETLVDGTLTLYAEDLDGRRRALAPVGGDTAVRDVPAGAPLASTEFRVEAPAERFVAVYQGTLGDERTSGGSSGAVVGKVLGGVRVEQVFAEDGQWKIRSPKGVVATDLTTLEYEVVRWGDGPSTLAARTRFGDNQPNRFTSFRVPREPDAPVELATAGGASVTLEKMRDVVFPFGMSAGSQVQFQSTVRYRQRIGTVDVRYIYDWMGEQIYHLVAIEGDAPVLSVVDSATFTFSDNFSIVLDTAHNNRFSVPDDRRYAWELMDFNADAAGRLRALVRVTLIRPGVAAATRPIITLNRGTGAPEASPHNVVISPRFIPDANPLLWAVIDLDERRVLASTAEPTIAMVADLDDEAPPLAESWGVSALGAIPGIWLHHIQTLNGGPFAGTNTMNYMPAVLTTVDPTRPDVLLRTTIEATTGHRSATVSGWRNGELTDAIGATFTVADVPATRYAGYWNGNWKGTVEAARIVTNVGRIVASPPQLTSAQRVPAGTAGERIVFVGQGRSDGPGSVVVWDGERGEARVVADLPNGSHFLRSATDSAAIVRTVTPSTGLPHSHVVSFDTARPMVTVPNTDLGASFTLLQPRYLYNPNDFRFYRVQPTPTKTALPTPLAGAGPTTGSFHTIRLP